MNHLAHAVLAAHDDRAIVGALLSDFVKGEGPAAYTPAVRAEILLHRQVDVFTDAHPAVRETIARFAPARRRFAGIALDVHFDHLLARQWRRHGQAMQPLSIEAFSMRVCDAIERFDEPLPEELAVLGERWRRHGGLAGYRDDDAVGFAIERLSRRLSRGGEHLLATREDLALHAREIEAAFERLWPELRAFVATTREALLRPGP